MLTEYQFALMQAIAKGNGRWTWYQIDRDVNAFYPEQAYHMMKVLRELEKHGIIESFKLPEFPHEVWQLTEMGKKLLDEGMGDK